LTNIQSLALVACGGIVILMPLQANQSDKKTLITLDAPLQVPAMTLQPGSLALKSQESASKRHLVTIWDQGGMNLANQPRAQRARLYPGENFGGDQLKFGSEPQVSAAAETAPVTVESPTATAIKVSSASGSKFTGFRGSGPGVRNACTARIGVSFSCSVSR
jgi:hypothetical protein